MKNRRRIIIALVLVAVFAVGAVLYFTVLGPALEPEETVKVPIETQQGEAIDTTDRIQIFPRITAENVQSISVKNEHGSLEIYISEDDPENGKTGVIFSGRTNSAGLSEKISLPAPPPENSEVPGGDDAYTKYNVEVIADGFYPVYSLDVPVFPGILSIQSVELVPTPREAEA